MRHEGGVITLPGAAMAYVALAERDGHRGEVRALNHHAADLANRLDPPTTVAWATDEPTPDLTPLWVTYKVRSSRGRWSVPGKPYQLPRLRGEG